MSDQKAFNHTAKLYSFDRNIKERVRTDAELIMQLRRKTRAGAEALYDRYSTALMLVIIRIVPVKASAEEVLCASYLKIWNTFNLYNEGQGMLFTWMKAIATKLANDVPIDPQH